MQQPAYEDEGQRKENEDFLILLKICLIDNRPSINDFKNTRCVY